MTVYNLSGLFNASNPLEIVLEINTLGDNLLLLVAFFAIGMLLIVGIKSNFPLEIALTLGGFITTIIGIMLTVLGLIPIWSPYVFAVITGVGLVIVYANKTQLT